MAQILAGHLDEQKMKSGIFFCISSCEYMDVHVCA